MAGDGRPGAEPARRAPGSFGIAVPWLPVAAGVLVMVGLLIAAFVLVPKTPDAPPAALPSARDPLLSTPVFSDLPLDPPSTGPAPADSAVVPTPGPSTDRPPTRPADPGPAPVTVRPA
ncbi:MAG TPA: hypothetical protein VF755_26175, partial [Catenuloplanes sp.]